MKAVAYYDSLPITENAALLDIDLPAPVPGERDLLVEVRAISVNPVDTKVRMRRKAENGEAVVLGWDAAGIVREVGAGVTLFKPGERVWYAGALTRPGTNSELHAVDERLVGHMPATLDFATAAALPLTSITAWELLFDRLQIARTAPASGVQPGAKGALLVIGAAGGVGSILVQLARKLTDVTVIGTASRPETRAWLETLGAHHVIDHTRPLSAELKRIGVPAVRYIVGLNHSDRHFPEMVASIAPQGRIAVIDDPEMFDVRLLKSKSVSLHWESMFTRSLFNTADQISQHVLLDEVAAMIDAGSLRSTLDTHLGTINAANLKRAHAFIESGKAKGKLVLEGF